VQHPWIYSCLSITFMSNIICWKNSSRITHSFSMFVSILSRRTSVAGTTGLSASYLRRAIIRFAKPYATMQINKLCMSHINVIIHSKFYFLNKLLSWPTKTNNSPPFSSQIAVRWCDGQIFTARCTLVQSAVLRSHVVCLSVRLSVCDVGELW